MHRRLLPPACVLVALACVLTCGCSNQMAPPPPAPPDMARGPTDHPPLWTLRSSGGPVQPAPEIYAVVWQGDEQLGADVADFVDWMLKSDYWTASLAEYGVGAGTGKGLIVLPEAPPATLTDADAQNLAAMLVSSGQVQLDAATQIAFLPPPSTTVMAFGETGCVQLAGYHGYAAKPGVVYSVVLRCSGIAAEPIDDVTEVLSHEAAEAATDPQPSTGYTAGPPSPQDYELADLCNFNSDIGIDAPGDATHPARRYWVQRLYSSERATKGNLDPCLPLPWDRPYWNVALDPSVVTIPQGSSQGVARLDVFAYGDVGTIKWFALSSDGSATVEPSFGTAQAGDTIPVTITLDSTARATHEIDIFSESEKAGAAVWFAYVGVN